MFVGRVGPVDRRSDGERSRRPREFEYIRYETIDDGRIAAITLDRPKQRNAQTRGMLVELGAAFELAEADDTVRVVILRAAGPAFSAGHDLDPLTISGNARPGRTSTPATGATGRPSAGSSHATARSGTTTSKTPSGGATCARSPSPRCTGPCCRRG